MRGHFDASIFEKPMCVRVRISAIIWIIANATLANTLNGIPLHERKNTITFAITPSDSANRFRDKYLVCSPHAILPYRIP